MKEQEDLFARPGGFFAIDRRCWRAACDLGRNPAVAYLALACGTGRDMRTTAWSRKAISEYAGFRWEQANAALQALIDAHLVSRVREGTRPLYKLLPFSSCSGPQDKARDWIWLPKEIVTGPKSKAEYRMPDEYSAMRQIIMDVTDGLSHLRLLIDLYRQNRDMTNRCVPWWLLRQRYERQTFGRSGDHNVFGFTPAGMVVEVNTLTRPYIVDPDRPWSDLELALNRLFALSLVDSIPHLVTHEGPEGEVIHPLSQIGTAALPIEQQVGQAAREAGLAMLPPDRRTAARITLVAPVHARYPQPCVVGMLRPRILPSSSATPSWLGRHGEWGWWTDRHVAAASLELGCGRTSTRYQQ